MAYTQRCPDQVIHHSDHGSEYTAVAFFTRCRELGITRSMGSVGDCFDNAMMESFFSSLEAEVLDRYRFQTRDAARGEIFSWIEGWYYPHGRHSGLGYVSPWEFDGASITSVRVLLTRFSRICVRPRRVIPIAQDHEDEEKVRFKIRLKLMTVYRNGSTLKSKVRTICCTITGQVALFNLQPTFAESCSVWPS